MFLSSRASVLTVGKAAGAAAAAEAMTIALAVTQRLLYYLLDSLTSFAYFGSVYSKYIYMYDNSYHCTCSICFIYYLCIKYVSSFI